MSYEKLAGIAERAARGGVYLFIGNALSIVVLAIGSIIIARLLGPASYGIYTLVLAVPSLFISIADAGMSSALVRFPAKLRSEGDLAGTNRAIRLAFLLKLFLSVAAFLICYFGADLIGTALLNRPDSTPYLQLAGLLIIFQAILNAASNSFIGLDIMQYSASTQIIYSLLKSILSPALILLGFGIGGAIAGFIIGVLFAGAIGTILLFAKRARSTSSLASRPAVQLRALISYSLPLYMASLLSVLITQYQNLVLARFVNDMQIGNFNAAWNFNSLLSILIYPISTAIFPMFSKIDSKKEVGNLARGYLLAVKYASLMLIPASIGVMVFSPDLVLLTYGRGYTLAPQFLAILCIQYLLTGLGLNVIGNFLSGVAATRTVLNITGLTLAVYLPLGPALTWLWGPNGLLVAYVLSFTISTLYGVSKVSLDFAAFPDLGASTRILAASIIAATPSVVLVKSYPTGLGLVNLAVGGCLFLFTYLTTAPILGAITPQDINNLETILCRSRATAAVMKPVLAYERRILNCNCSSGRNCRSVRNVLGQNPPSDLSMLEERENTSYSSRGKATS
jgi:stage V sporulation protein B